jgi:glycine dehydrogenase subunit 1
MSSSPLHFLPNSPKDVTSRMLHSVGVSSIDELFLNIPEELQSNSFSRIPEALSELEIQSIVEEYLSLNKIPPDYPCFLGGGHSIHHVPAAVDEVISRSEFQTSYTPYQPEISQGVLQALFEYQSLICELTGMGAANSSMYDGCSATAEAIRMAGRVTKRNKILMTRSSGPERRQVTKTYLQHLNYRIGEVPFSVNTGQMELSELEDMLDRETAAIYFEYPNYFGVLDVEMDELIERAHSKGALAIVGINPSSLGVLKPPGEFDADIVVGEGQPLGIHMNYGGPSLGVFAVRDDPDMIRQMPGRIIGMTTTKDGLKRGFSQVLQTREQHIRRERATSNICTNESLMAIASACYMALLGAEGLKQLGLKTMENCSYAIRQLSKLPGVRAPRLNSPFYQDFTVQIDSKDDSLQTELQSKGVLGGLALKDDYPEFDHTFLFSVTEVHRRSDIDKLVSAIREVTE